MAAGALKVAALDTRRSPASLPASMVALRPGAAPPLPDARRVLSEVFGPEIVEGGGAVYSYVAARGAYRGLPVVVRLETCQTERHGLQPFTKLELAVDLDVYVYTGGAAWPYPPYEAHVAFPHPRIANTAAVGAPRELLAAIAGGPIGARLGETGINRLSVGADATRDGSPTRGVLLVVEGWPFDAPTLTYLLDTVAAIGGEATRALDAARAGGRAIDGRHPEVVAYETERRRVRGKAKVIVIGVVLGAVVLILVGLAAFVLLMMRPR